MTFALRLADVVFSRVTLGVSPLVTAADWRRGKSLGRQDGRRRGVLGTGPGTQSQRSHRDLGGIHS